MSVLFAFVLTFEWWDGGTILLGRKFACASENLELGLVHVAFDMRLYAYCQMRFEG
jgi:hypothetical protein